jgi:hypothetical protein
MIKSIILKIYNSEKLSALVFCLLVFAVYALYPTRTFYWDGIIYSKYIEDAPGFGAHLFHSNHLIYNFLGYLSYHAAQSFGWQIRALFVLQFVTTVFGALCALVFFRIAKSVFRSTYLSLSMTALFAFSAAWWKFSTDADVYIISGFFLLASFFLVLPEKTPRPFQAAFTHILAMFFHQLAVLFFPVVVLGLIFQTSTLERRKRISIILQYSLAAFLLTFGTYYLSFYLQTGGFDFKDFVKWMISYASSAGFGFDVWESLRLGFRGNRQLFIDGSAKLFERSFFNYILLAIFIASAIALLFQIARNFKEIKIFVKNFAKQNFYKQPVVLLCAVWILPYLIFLFLFMPENYFYRLFYFPALIVLVGTFLLPFENLKQIRRGRLALFVFLFCLYNFLFYIQPNSKIRENTQIAVALKAANIWSGKTVVFYDALTNDDTHEANNRLVRYFNPSVVWKPLEFTDLREFENEVRRINVEGGKVWLESLAIKRMTANPQTAQWLADNANLDAKPELFVPEYDMKFIEIIPKSFGKVGK